MIEQCCNTLQQIQISLPTQEFNMYIVKYTISYLEVFYEDLELKTRIWKKLINFSGNATKNANI